MKQPRALDYSDEGGPTDSCSPQMSNGRGPRRSTKDFMKKYGLELTASTFLIVDSGFKFTSTKNFYLKENLHGMFRSKVFFIFP